MAAQAAAGAGAREADYAESKEKFTGVTRKFVRLVAVMATNAALGNVVDALTEEPDFPYEELSYPVAVGGLALGLLPLLGGMMLFTSPRKALVNATLYWSVLAVMMVVHIEIKNLNLPKNYPKEIERFRDVVSWLKMGLFAHALAWV